MEAFKKMAALLKGSIGDIMQYKSVGVCLMDYCADSLGLVTLQETSAASLPVVFFVLFSFLLGSRHHIPSMLCALTYTQQSLLSVTYLEMCTDALYKCGLPLQTK